MTFIDLDVLATVFGGVQCPNCGAELGGGDPQGGQAAQPKQDVFDRIVSSGMLQQIAQGISGIISNAQSSGAQSQQVAASPVAENRTYPTATPVTGATRSV